MERGIKSKWKTETGMNSIRNKIRILHRSDILGIQLITVLFLQGAPEGKEFGSEL